MRRLVFPALLLTAALVASAALQPAFAEDWHHGDIHNFHDHDFDRWRGGNWFNGFHDGRNGWWWIVDGAWYFYPAPVYPYPDPYTPPVVAVAPGTAVVATPAYLYYCKNPAGYYPYVPQCFGHWHRVVATTAQAPGTVIIQQQPAVPVAPQAAPQPAPPMAAVPAGGEREADARKLNALAGEFENVDLTGQRAAEKLKDVEKKVDVFRESLSKRNYNAVDMLKNADDLHHRIAAEREKLAKSQAGENAPPPGTTVTFPPQ